MFYKFLIIKYKKNIIWLVKGDFFLKKKINKKKKIVKKWKVIELEKNLKGKKV